MHIQIETELLPQKPAVTQGKALRGGPNPVGFSLPDAHQTRMVPGGPQYRRLLEGQRARAPRKFETPRSQQYTHGGGPRVIVQLRPESAEPFTN